MKKNFLKAIQTLLVFSLVFTLTNCGNIDNPLEELSGSGSVPPSVVEEAKVLGEALEAGATVTINYTVEDQSYIAIFQKGDGDTYTLISNEQKTSTTRAMTRGLAQLVTTGDGATVGDKVQLKLVGNKLVLIVKADFGTPLFEAQMNVAGGEVTVTNTNAIGINGSIGAVSINDQEKGIKNPEMHSVIIQKDYVSYAVKYSEGETWANVVDRYKNNESVEITTTTDGYVSIKFSKEIVVNALIANGYRETNAESEYTNEFSGSFYLTEGGSNARGMTRASAPTYAKATDAVGAHDIYRLITAPVALSAVTSELGWIVGSDGKAYAKKRYLPEGTDAVAMIVYVGSDNGEAAPYNHGLALALNDETSTMAWQAAIDACSAKNTSTPVTNATWLLASKDQWTNMINACMNVLGTNNNYQDLRDGFSGISGADNLQSGVYWSSTENGSNEAWDYGFGDGFWYGDYKVKDDVRVRACLAF